MKKIYLVHCWDGTCSDGWYPWIEEKLKDNNIEVIRFNMPNTSSPKISEWVGMLNNKVDKAENEYEKFRIKQDREYISSMDEMYKRYLEGDEND